MVGSHSQEISRESARLRQMSFFWSDKAQGGPGSADVGVMANTSKQSKVKGLSAPAPSGSLEISEPLSPKVKALRKLVASGQYQVSSRYLAIQIFRRAGLRTE